MCVLHRFHAGFGTMGGGEMELILGWHDCCGTFSLEKLKALAVQLGWHRSDDSMGTDAIGASLSIVSSVISNVGINLQKRVHLANDKRPLSQKVPYVKVPEWWIGLGGVVRVLSLATP